MGKEIGEMVRTVGSFCTLCFNTEEDFRFSMTDQLILLLFYEEVALATEEVSFAILTILAPKRWLLKIFNGIFLR